jgi:hypothetical protein
VVREIVKDKEGIYPHVTVITREPKYVKSGVGHETEAEEGADGEDADQSK